MSWTGRLQFTPDGASRLAAPRPLEPREVPVPDMVSLVIQGGAPNPFFAATRALRGDRFTPDQQIIVIGQSSTLGNVPVILMAGAQPAAGVRGAAKKAGAKKAGAKKGGGTKKAAKKGAPAKSADAGRKSGKKAAAKSAAKKSAPKKTSAKKTSAKKSAKKSARKGGKKQR